MYLFYCPDIATTLTLSEEESAHCVQVLRRSAGDEILVTDGIGQLYHCVITNPHRKHCEVEIRSVETPEPLHEGHIHMVIAPTKNIDRTELAIEKCVEMGVDELTLVLCEHSERKTVNMERLQKILVSAAKQSLKTCFPLLHPLTKMTELQIEGGCPADKTLVTPNGIDQNRLADIPGKDPDDEFVNVGAVLRVTPIKDVKTLINAFYIAKRREPRLKLWIMGPMDEDPDYTQECQDLVEAISRP